MVRSRRRILWSAVALAVVAGSLSMFGPAVTSAGAEDRHLTIPEMELWAFCRLNLHRAQAGLPQLELDVSLRNGSRSWAKHLADMSQQRGGPVLMHDPNHGANAENVAYTAGFSSFRRIDQMWMDSDGHRANRMNRAYHSMGIGFERRTINGVDWLFATERFNAATTPDKQPDCDGVVLGRPTDPIKVKAEPERRAARVTWEAPYYRGFTTINQYEVQCKRDNHQRTVTSKDLKAFVADLKEDKTYYCRVRAHNGQGWGQWSPVDRVHTDD